MYTALEEEEELKPTRTGSRDTELTLDARSITLLVLFLIFFGALCFGMGYSFGHRHSYNATEPAVNPANPVATDPGNLPAAPSGKPAASSATPAPAAQPVAQQADSNNDETGGDPNNPDAEPDPHAQLTTSSPHNMVQVAAVADEDNAEMLTRAMRKRGYAASVQHNPADGKLIVMIGPFANRQEATQARQRLQDAGYKAVLQP